jgi:hypothetical protein
MSFADQIAKDRGQPGTVRVGTVLSVVPLVVSVQGSLFTDVGVLAGFVPVVGQTVALLGQSSVSADGSSWLALGAVTSSATAGTPSTHGVQTMASVQNNGTAVFAAITGVTFQFIKRRTESRILAHMTGSSFVTNAGNAAEFGAQIVDNAGVLASTDNALASLFYNLATTHLAWSGFRYLTGVPAGSYTVNGQFRLYIIVAGSVNFDTNDRISLGFTEVD